MQESRHIGLDLTSIAGVDLYHDNAFRLSGLPVDASLRQVRRRSTELEAADRLGAELPRSDGPLPVDPPPTNAEILAALRRLHDPNRRIVDELLWLWPRSEGDEHAVALHNSAVEAHVSALEDDHSDAAVDGQWGSVYTLWDEVLEEDACWDWLVRRVEAIGDPQLRASTVDDLRLALPELLMATHAGLAVAEFAHDENRGFLHTNAMLEAERDYDQIDRALLGALQPQISRLKSLAERTRGASGDTDFQRVCQAAVEESDADLAVLRELLGTNHFVVSGVADDLASGMRERIVGAVNRIPEDEKVERRVEVGQGIQWLDRAERVAIGAHAKRQIGEDVQTLLSNLVVFACRAAEEESRRSPRSGLAAQGKLMDSTRKALWRIRPHDIDRYLELRDEVAGTAFLVLVEYVRVSGDGPTALGEFRALLPVANDPVLRERLTQVVTALELGGRLGAESSGALRSVWDAAGGEGACASCDRAARGTRNITMMSSQPLAMGNDTITVEVASCGRCRRVSLFQGLARGIGGLCFVALIVLAPVVWFSSLTWSASDWVFGWLIAGFGTTAYLSGRGTEERRQRLQRHPAIVRRMSDGWLILN